MHAATEHDSTFSQSKSHMTRQMVVLRRLYDRGALLFSEQPADSRRAVTLKVVRLLTLLIVSHTGPIDSHAASVVFIVQSKGDFSTNKLTALLYANHIPT